MTKQILRFYPRIVNGTDPRCQILEANNRKELVGIRSYDLFLLSSIRGD